VKRISPHLGRGPSEPINTDIRRFYDCLLGMLKNAAFREGQWRLLEGSPAWEGNESWDGFIVFAWTGGDGCRFIVAVNYAPHQGQCHVRLPYAELAGKKWRLQDQLSANAYDWNGDDLRGRGLYLDMAPWQAVVFAVTLV